MKFNKNIDQFLMKKSQINFEELYSIISAKIASHDEKSYTNKLAKGDVARLVQKIGEEGVEVTIAGILHDKNNSEQSRQNLINEVCDLFYHSLVLLAKNEINLSEVFEEFNKRNNH